MQGVLFRYGPAAPQIAFRSSTTTGSSTARHHLILVAGLTDGLLALPYAPRLAAAAEAAGYSLVQAQLSSSYAGWGVGSLDSDADELLLLSQHLRAELGSQGLVVIGHSTGCQVSTRFDCYYHLTNQQEGAAHTPNIRAQNCNDAHTTTHQDAIRFCQRHGTAQGAAPLQGIILQAPVRLIGALLRSGLNCSQSPQSSTLRAPAATLCLNHPPASLLTRPSHPN